MRNSIVCGKFKEASELGKKGHIKYSVLEKSRGQELVYFLPLIITFSTAVQPVSAIASKPPITPAGLAEIEWNMTIAQ